MTPIDSRVQQLDEETLSVFAAIGRAAVGDGLLDEMNDAELATALLNLQDHGLIQIYWPDDGEPYIQVFDPPESGGGATTTQHRAPRRERRRRKFGGGR